MQAYEKFLLNCLFQIQKMLENCKDKNFIKVLKEDKNKICSCLNLDFIPPKINNSSTYDEIKANIITNEIDYNPITPIYLFKKNRSISNSKLFEEFIRIDEFGLKQIYDNPNTHIFYSNNRFNCLGENIYIKSLNINYIKIYRTNKIDDYSVLVHELGHAKLNLVHPKAFEKNYSCNYSEAYSNFLKLMFLNFIGTKGRTNDSFNLKYLFFEEFTATKEVLLEKLYSYLTFNEQEKSLFDYQYKLLMSDLLTMYLYNLYKKDKNECLKVLNIFINNFGRLSDSELLKSMGVDSNNFKNLKIISKFIDNLNKERYEIKHKHSHRLW